MPLLVCSLTSRTGRIGASVPVTVAARGPSVPDVPIRRLLELEKDMANIADLLSQSADRRPDQMAIKVDESELATPSLTTAAARVAGLLRAKGVQPGDRVGIMLPNVAHFAVCYYGALRIGAADRADEPAAQGARGRVLPR